MQGRCAVWSRHGLVLGTREYVGCRPVCAACPSRMRGGVDPALVCAQAPLHLLCIVLKLVSWGQCWQQLHLCRAHAICTHSVGAASTPRAVSAGLGRVAWPLRLAIAVRFTTLKQC